jgi:hypothetical protein
MGYIGSGAIYVLPPEESIMDSAIKKDLSKTSIKVDSQLVNGLSLCFRENQAF